MIVTLNHKPFMTVGVKEEIKEYAIKHVSNEKDKNAIVNFIRGKEIKSERRFKRAVTFVHGLLLASWIQATMATTAMAATKLTEEEQSVIGDVDGFLFKLQLICLGICVSVAVLMAMVAGFFRIIGLREEAKKRYMDAISGMTMILTAPVVLGLIAPLIRGLLKLFPSYA